MLQRHLNQVFPKQTAHIWVFRRWVAWLAQRISWSLQFSQFTAISWTRIPIAHPFVSANRVLCGEGWRGRNEKQGKERRGEETREWVDESVLFSSGLMSWGVKEMWAHTALASHFKNDRWKLGMEAHTLIPALGVRSQLVLYSEFQDDQVEGNRWCPGKDNADRQHYVKELKTVVCIHLFLRTCNNQRKWD